MYWGTPSATDPTTPRLPWRDGHATAGAVMPAQRWAFAEGQQGTPSGAGAPHHTFFLLANPNPSPIGVRATFARTEDGRGIVRTVCVAPNARANIWAAEHPELGGRRFSTFLESVPVVTCRKRRHAAVRRRARLIRGQRVRVRALEHRHRVACVHRHAAAERPSMSIPPSSCDWTTHAIRARATRTTTPSTSIASAAGVGCSGRAMPAAVPTPSSRRCSLPQVPETSKSWFVTQVPPGRSRSVGLRHLPAVSFPTRSGW